MLESADPWFIQLAAAVLGLYFLWSMRGVLKDFKDEVRDLKETLKTLFRRGDDHEHRISRLEGRCDAMHGADAGQGGGRRFYDPSRRQEKG